MTEPITEIPRIAVAAVDILGIQSKIEVDPGGRTAALILSRFLKNACSPQLHHPGAVTTRLYAARHHFTDSVYLYADPSLDLDAQLEALSARVSTLIALGLWTEPRFLVRAGIAVGKLTVVTTEVDNQLEEIRIGSALTSAHRLQGAQEWIGAAIDATVPIGSKTARWLVSYAVPMKPESRCLKPLAINWLGHGTTLEIVEKEVTAAVGVVPVGSKESVKRDNTLNFAQTVYESGRLAPFERPAWVR